MTMACMLGGFVSTPGPIDICLMPPIPPRPQQYMNIGTWSMSMDFVPEVLINASPSCNLGTIIYESNGDQAGAFGGVISHTIMGTITPITGAFNVLLNGLPACNLGMTLTLSNLDNTVGIYDIPSQVDVIAI